MISAATVELSHRDIAVLRAVADGRCELSDRAGPVLTVDGRCFCDQLAAPRLTGAGLLVAPDADRMPARLTAAGQAMLAAA